MNKSELRDALSGVFVSPNVSDSNLEPANVVDALDSIARSLSSVATWIKYLGNGDAASTMGAIEFHGIAIKEASETIARALRDVADAIRDSSDPR